MPPASAGKEKGTVSVSGRRESLELVTDASEEIDNDIRAWCRTRGQYLTFMEVMASADINGFIQ